jgi:hypothetical protein
MVQPRKKEHIVIDHTGYFNTSEDDPTQYIFRLTLFIQPQ